ncbi:MAG: nucleotidyltransferase domain-containing protein [Clostridium sp.]
MSINKDNYDFVQMVANIITNNKINIDKINYSKIIEYAYDQNLETLILEAFKENNISEGNINYLKKQSILNNIRQLKFINKLKEVLSLIVKEDIKVVLLKGLVLRTYYRNPLYRTMGDGDILVEEKNIDRVIKILEGEGFKVISGGPVHIHMKDENNFIIEVHKCLIKHQIFNNEDSFNKYIWNDLAEFKFENLQVYRLNSTNFITHMMVHLAKHKKSKNISIRALCDLVVFIEKESNNIHWQVYIKNIEELNIKKFSDVMFLMIEELFHINIPINVKNNVSQETKISYNKEIVDKILNEIFEGGVHGKKGEQSYSNNMIKTFDRKVMIEVNKLNDRYKYAKRYNILLPIAWLHRIIRGIFNKKVPLRDKFKYAFMSKERKNQLIEINNWLEL